MKIFVMTFFISFSLLIGSYLLFTHFSLPDPVLSQKKLLDAIVRDDVETVAQLLSKGQKTEFAIDYSFELPTDSIYRFYASETAMLYNPISLAIVAGAEKSLPLILADTKDIKLLNELTASHYKKDGQLGKSSYDLLALAVRTDNLKLLRQLIAAGLKPERQNYLVVAFFVGRKESDNKNFSRAMFLESLRQRSAIIVELINSGQTISQRLPVPFPMPTAVEMFFMLAGPEIRDAMIEDIRDEKVKKQLTEVASRMRVKPTSADKQN
ncbi:MAG: hypothetical protein CVV42_08960 [Candidatus Riflebacteria bacterium HGW-Riflebacteria-2]|jgi:hypothetical protein|nr:MAG: hypothetical protein CVV42_08960 [Candidatus Riflebacteria bacterium HGW-Riflebacteria-2]